MDLTTLKKKLSSRFLGREKREVDSPKTFTQTLSVPSLPQSSDATPQSTHRPFFRRAVSAPIATRETLAVEQLDLPVIVIPASLPPLVLPPIVLRMTTGPTILRSNLPKRVPQSIRPKTTRKSVDEPPPFGHKSSVFSTSMSMPALSEMASPSTTSITVIPPSPPAPRDDCLPTYIPPPPPARPIITPELALPASTPVLEQEPIFPSASLPSPSSEFGGDLYTPSPSLGSFHLPQYPARRPITTCCIPEETSSNGSPTSIRSRMDPESPVLMVARLVKVPSRATLLTFNPQRPITLDLSTATRKPNHKRRQASLPGSSSSAGPSSTPASPNYARPLALGRSSPSQVDARSPVHQLELEVEETGSPKPHRRVNPFQDMMDALDRAALVDANLSAVGTAL